MHATDWPLCTLTLLHLTIITCLPLYNCKPLWNCTPRPWNLTHFGTFMTWRAISQESQRPSRFKFSSPCYRVLTPSVAHDYVWCARCTHYTEISTAGNTPTWLQYPRALDSRWKNNCNQSLTYQICIKTTDLNLPSFLLIFISSVFALFRLKFFDLTLLCFSLCTCAAT